MSKLAHKKVLITGGASGIGKIMARLLLQRNCEVILWDIDRKSLADTCEEFSKYGHISGYEVDVSDTKQVRETARKVKAKNGEIDLLINNAGILKGDYFHEQTPQNIDRVMRVNAIAPMHVTRVFIKDMMHRNQGHICNIASSAGLLGNPNMALYVASKWALTGWSESLRIEMKQLQKNVKLTTIMPYYIRTKMIAGVRSRLPVLEPEAAARKIIKAIEKNKKLVSLPSYIYPGIRLAQALLPVSVFDWLVGSVLGVYQTMEHFNKHD